MAEIVQTVIPLKKTSLPEYEESANAIAHHLNLQHEHQEDVESFYGLRARVSMGGLEDLQSLVDYHAVLEDFEQRGIFDNFMHFNFAWSCALQEPQNIVSEHSVSYERSCVMFNLGSVQSYLASRDFQMSDGKPAMLDKAYRQYQLAASLFNHLRTKFMQLSSFSLDMTNPGLEMLEKIMLAQGQACFLEFGIRSSTRQRPQYSVLAKIAMYSAELFTQGIMLAQSPILMNKIDDRWGGSMHVNSLVMRAKAEYYESMSARKKADQTKKGFGMEIARLCLAESFCMDALSTAREYTDFNTSEQAIDALLASIRHRKMEAQTYNQQGLMEQVPEPRTLSSIQGHNMTKLVPIEPLLGTAQTQPLLTGIVSQQIPKQAVIELKRRLQETCLSLTEQVQQHTEHATSRLARAKLPQSVAAYEAGDMLPESLWSRISELQQTNELETLKNNLRKFRDVTETARSILIDTVTQLKEDYQLDEEFRQKYPNFTGKQAKTFQQSIWAEIQADSDLLDNAQRGDVHLFSMLKCLETDEKYQYLMRSRKDLDYAISQCSCGEQNPHSFDTSLLNTHLINLNELLINRQNILVEFMTNLEQFDAATSDGSNQSFNIHRVTAMFDQWQTQIMNNLERQRPILEQIFAENQRFVDAWQYENGSGEKAEFLKMLEEAAATIRILKDQLIEGTKFYRSIIPRLDKSKQAGSEQSILLAVEREEYKDIQNDKASLLKQEQDDLEFAKRLVESENPTEVQKSDAELAFELANNGPSNDINMNGDVPMESEPLLSDENGHSNTPHQESNTPQESHDNVMAVDNFSDGAISDAAPPSSTPMPEEPQLRNPQPHEPQSHEPQAPQSSFGMHNGSRQRYGVGAVSVNNNEPPQVRPNDKKVAQLVEMGFDPDLAVSALISCDNNEHDALAQLLT